MKDLRSIIAWFDKERREKVKGGKEGEREVRREKGGEWMYMYKTLKMTTGNGTVSFVRRILSTVQSLLFPMFINL